MNGLFQIESRKSPFYKIRRVQAKFKTFFIVVENITENNY
jgi:hypothetical protein